MIIFFKFLYFINIYMDYYQKYKKYEKKYYQLKAGMMSPEERTAEDKRLYLGSWCFNNDIKIVYANPILMDYKKITFKDKEYRIKLPEIIEAEIKYDYGDDEIVSKNRYQFKKFLSSGTYGSVFQYSKIDDHPGLSNIVCKVILSYDTDDSIRTRILPELNAVLKIKDSPCKKIDSYILNLARFYIKSIEEYDIYFDRNINKHVAMTVMPMADGDVYNNLYRLGNMTFDENRNLFNYCVETLKCMLINHDLVYPDLKLEQLLFFKCPSADGSNKYIFTIGDLGGFQKFLDHPISSYGPHPEILRSEDISSVNLALYALAALWQDLYGSNTEKKILNLAWSKNKIFKIGFDELAQLVEEGLPHIDGLEHQRMIISEILSMNPKDITSKEQILSYLDRL